MRAAAGRIAIVRGEPRLAVAGIGSDESAAGDGLARDFLLQGVRLKVHAQIRRRLARWLPRRRARLLLRIARGGRRAPAPVVQARGSRPPATLDSDRASSSPPGPPLRLHRGDDQPAADCARVRDRDVELQALGAVDRHHPDAGVASARGGLGLVAGRRRESRYSKPPRSGPAGLELAREPRPACGRSPSGRCRRPAQVDTSYRTRRCLDSVSAALGRALAHSGEDAAKPASPPAPRGISAAASASPRLSPFSTRSRTRGQMWPWRSRPSSSPTSPPAAAARRVGAAQAGDAKPEERRVVGGSQHGQQAAEIVDPAGPDPRPPTT